MIRIMRPFGMLFLAGVNLVVGCESSKKDPASVVTGDGGVVDAMPGPVYLCPGDGGFALPPDAGTKIIRPPSDAGPGAASCDPDIDEPLEPAMGRLRYCAVDIGSKNVKLTSAAMMPGDLTSLVAERDCKAAKSLGDKTYDQKTETAGQLSAV